MKNELYRSVIVPANNAVDGETATVVVVTEEANCWVIWFFDYDTECPLHVELRDRNAAIRKGVYFGQLKPEQLAEHVRRHSWGSMV